MSLKCLVVDDEPLARKGIINHIERIDYLSLEGQCGSAAEAQELLNEGQFDLMFLDIKMPKISGLEFLKALKNPPLVIFTTAYPDYALEGYELDVVDYLLKPIDFERFLQAAQKAREVYQAYRSNEEVREEDSENKEFIYVKDDQKYVKIRIEDILFIEAWKDYVMIYTPQDKQIALVNMKNMEKQIPEAPFIRVHRSYLVAKNRIDAMRGNILDVSGFEIPVGRSYRDQVYEEVISRNLISRNG